MNAHDALLALDFDTYVGGHVYRTGTKKDVQESRDFLMDLFTETKKAMGEVPFDAKVEAGNAWAAQTVWFDRVATKVTATLVAKWKTKLAGVDTFTHDTVIAAIVSLSTDAPKIRPSSRRGAPMLRRRGLGRAARSSASGMRSGSPADRFADANVAGSGRRGYR